MFIICFKILTKNQKHRPATGDNAYRQDIVSVYRRRS